MAKGGKRPGAGRPKGSKDKISKELDEAVAARGCPIGEGQTPLEFMLAVMRDVELADVELRLEAAKAAAPYVHRKQPQDVNVDAKGFPTPAPLFVVVNAPGGLPDDKRAE